MLKGKNAVVTGSTSGIGLGIAREFAKDGANVLINGFGPAADIEKERAGIEREQGVGCQDSRRAGAGERCACNQGAAHPSERRSSASAVASA